MNGTIDDRYFEWLYGQVASVRNRNPHRSYWALLRQLYVKPYLWYIRNDDNRANDGIELRHEFLDEEGDGGVDPNWLTLECSVLEMLIAFSRRAAFQTGESPVEWFWRFIENLDCRGYTDEAYNELVREEVNANLERFIERRYDANGRGGLFPLDQPQEDQRNVEIFYQFSAYAIERDARNHTGLFTIELR